MQFDHLTNQFCALVCAKLFGADFLNTVRVLQNVYGNLMKRPARFRAAVSGSKVLQVDST